MKPVGSQVTEVTEHAKGNTLFWCFKHWKPRQNAKMKIKMKPTHSLNFFAQFNFSTYRIGRSVMKRLRMPQHADTDVRLRTPAALLQEDRELLVTNHSL